MRIGFDFDGVLSVTPFGRFAVHAPRPVADLPADYAALYDTPQPSSALRLAIEYARFGWRRMAPNADAILRELSARHELFIVTGRSVAGLALVERWLRQRGLSDAVVAVRMAPRGLRPPQHKLAIARMLALHAHIDDDPRTAYHLAANGVPQVYLLDHAHAHGDAPLPERVTLVRSLRDFADHIDR
jgi:hypothetical protein